MAGIWDEKYSSHERRTSFDKKYESTVLSSGLINIPRNCDIDLDTAHVLSLSIAYALQEKDLTPIQTNTSLYRAFARPTRPPVLFTLSFGGFNPKISCPHHISKYFKQEIPHWIRKVLRRRKIMQESNPMAPEDLTDFNFDIHIPILLKAGEAGNNRLSISHFYLYVFKFRDIKSSELKKISEENDDKQIPKELYSHVTVCLLDSLNLDCVKWNHPSNRDDKATLESLLPTDSQFEEIICPQQISVHTCGDQLALNSVQYAVTDKPPEHMTDNQKLRQQTVETLEKQSEKLASLPTEHEQQPAAEFTFFAPKKPRLSRNAFFSSTVLSMIIASAAFIILSETLAAASITLLGGLWGLFSIAAASTLLLTLILYLILLAMHAAEEKYQPKAIPSILPHSIPLPTSAKREHIRYTPPPSKTPLTPSPRKPSFRSN